MEDDNGSGQVSVGVTLLVLGAALGAVATLLLSPSGQQLKAQVSGAAGDWQEKAAGWRARAADALAQGRERVVEAIEKTTEDAQAGRAA